MINQIRKYLLSSSDFAFCQTLLCHSLESLCEHSILEIAENYPASYDYVK